MKEEKMKEEGWVYTDVMDPVIEVYSDFLLMLDDIGELEVDTLNFYRGSIAKHLEEMLEKSPNTSVSAFTVATFIVNAGLHEHNRVAAAYKMIKDEKSTTKIKDCPDD
jgi:hypothetical protein